MFHIQENVPIEFGTEWYYRGELATIPDEKVVGFVYCITNITTGKKYIGKKLVRFKKTKQKTVTLKNGNKKKKKITEYTESDWKEYYGSNDYLKRDVVELGADKFHREILEWCYSPGEMTYLETWYHFHFNVVLFPEKYYNGWIMCRVSSTHVKRLIQK